MPTDEIQHSIQQILNIGRDTTDEEIQTVQGMLVMGPHTLMCEATYQMQDMMEDLYSQRESEKRNQTRKRGPSVQELKTAAVGAGEKPVMRGPKQRKPIATDTPDSSDDEQKSQNAEEVDDEPEPPEHDTPDSSAGGDYSDLEDFDIEKSSAAIHEMLNQLQNGNQLQAMEHLYAEMSARAAEFAADRGELENAEIDFASQVDQFSNGVDWLENAIGEKELDTFQELHQFNKKLQHARVEVTADITEAQTRRRVKLSKQNEKECALKQKLNKQKSDLSKSETEGKDKIQDNADLEQLRTRLKNDFAQASQKIDRNSSSLNSGELFGMITGQQNDMEGVEDALSQQIQRLRLLRSSLAYVKGEPLDDDQEVMTEVIEQVKDKFQRQSAQLAASTAPVEDENLESHLEEEVADLRAKADQLKQDMETLTNVGVPMPTKTKKVEEEVDPRTKWQIEAEGAEPDEDSDNPYLRLAALMDLMPQAEVVTAQVESEREIFMNSIGRSREPVLGVPEALWAAEDHAEDQLAEPDTTSSSILNDDSAEEKLQEKLQQNLKEIKDEIERKKLAMQENAEEIENQMKAVKAAKEEVQTIKEQIGKTKEVLANKIGQIGCATFTTRQEGEAELKEIKGQIAELQQRAQEAESELEEERRRANADQEQLRIRGEEERRRAKADQKLSKGQAQGQTDEANAEMDAKPSVPSSTSRLATWRKSAGSLQSLSVEEKQVSAPGADEISAQQPTKQAEAELQKEPPLQPRVKLPPKPKNKEEEDREKLLQLQKDNAELAHQIELIEEQTDNKSFKKRGTVDVAKLAFLNKKNPDEEEAKAAEEERAHLMELDNQDMQKKIRKMQKALTQKRENWRKEKEEKKEPGASSSVRRTSVMQEGEDGEAENKGSNSPQSPFSIFEKVRASLQGVAHVNEHHEKMKQMAETQRRNSARRESTRRSLLGAVAEIAAAKEAATADLSLSTAAAQPPSTDPLSVEAAAPEEAAVEAEAPEELD